MEKAGYLHYEISSFCKPGYHSKHNLAYWQDEDFIGLGCGASGKENNVRYDNTRSLKHILNQELILIYMKRRKRIRRLMHHDGIKNNFWIRYTKMESAL